MTKAVVDPLRQRHKCLYRRNVHTVFRWRGSTKGKKPHGRPRRRWEDNIKTDLQEVEWGLDWIDVA